MADWRERAACQGSDPGLWFSADKAAAASASERQRVREAKAICARCQVRPDCLLFALGNHQRYGIWGGQTETELASLRRSRSRHRLDRLVSLGGKRDADA